MGFEHYLSRQDVAVGGPGIPSSWHLLWPILVHSCCLPARKQYKRVLNTWTCIVIGGWGLSAPFLAILLFMMFNVVLKMFLWSVSSLTLAANCYRLLANVLDSHQGIGQARKRFWLDTVPDLQSIDLM